MSIVDPEFNEEVRRLYRDWDNRPKESSAEITSRIWNTAQEMKELHMTTPRIPLSDLNILRIGTDIQMSGMVYSDRDKTYLVMFPDEHDAVDKPTVALNMNHAEWLMFIQQTDHLDVEMLAPGEDGKIVKTVVRKSQRQIDQGTSWKVYKRDGYRCRYCGLDDVPLTVDHLVCWEEGGPSTPDNLVAACRKCNKTRSNLPYKEWLKHPYYLKVSRNLIGFAQQANEKVADTLHLIPRQKIRSR